MPSEDVDHYYIVSTSTKERSRYSTLAEAAAALGGMLELQVARGYSNERNPSGRYISKHPDSPPVMFWIENAREEVVP